MAVSVKTLFHTIHHKIGLLKGDCLHPPPKSTKWPPVCTVFVAKQKKSWLSLVDGHLKVDVSVNVQSISRGACVTS